MTNWENLRTLAEKRTTVRIADLFAEQGRAEQFSASSDGVLFDYSKTTLDSEVQDTLIQMAIDAGLEQRRDEMFEGARINETEHRAVLHTALRALNDREIVVDGQDVVPEVAATRSRMAEFAASIRSGQFVGQGGAITDVVNIGIGGSDLGPAMGVLALAPYHDGPRCHFVSNVDGADIHDTLSLLNPETTLVIVASKTFTTIETMTNANTAKDWMSRRVADPATQFAALSTAEDLTAEFGLPADRVFGFEEWVGGRYSMWGPIGLSLMIAIGPEAFTDFLRGGMSMDDHFRSAPLSDNLPVLLALVGIWHHQGCGYATRAVLPYDQRLSRLPAYLQQLEMESNGKSVAMDGEALAVPSGPVVWGEPGTNGQHAFYQLIHQGTAVIPCEFLVAAQGHEPGLMHQHRLLVANCLAQSEALMLGRDLRTARALMREAGFEGEELDRQARHRVFPGNRPSTTLIYEKLTPYVLGQIIALYEHRVFVEGVMLGINSFDQWGVELGKVLATEMEPLVGGTKSADHKDGSTQQLLKFNSSRKGTG